MPPTSLEVGWNDSKGRERGKKQLMTVTKKSPGGERRSVPKCTGDIKNGKSPSISNYMGGGAKQEFMNRDMNQVEEKT